ncbi:hypothetical protein DPMN_074423 [Dreissena polymorpha]|uniref:Uncharacterized protein n=1 Tax=Dreissena polymorpha TaxID=45954 RepID=A0A9D4BNC9_DREPO|nr:hypothetical protein DPMN_074423 [Dreissena polymorpha]
MDCESKKLRISDICTSILNASLNVTVLKAGNNGIGDLGSFDLDGCTVVRASLN